MNSRRKIVTAALVLSCAICTAALADGGLAEGFKSPPHAAKPLVWWHWMNGNVTREGVRNDLEWMRRVGIGGVQNIDASLNTPQLVERPIHYLTPEWRQTLRDSVQLAGELGLDFDIESTPGWSVSGGPWVEPRQAMKKLVWSETRIDGGKPFTGRLADPPRTTGLFQSVPLDASNQKKLVKVPDYYADVAVIAYRAPPADTLDAAGPTVTSSAGVIDGARLRDGDLGHAVSLPFNGDQPAWILFSFSRPQRIQAVSAVIGKIESAVGLPELETREAAWLEASTDGRAFRKIVDLPRRGASQQTAAFAPVTAQWFRVKLDRPPPAIFGFETPAEHRIAELVLHGGARVHRFEDKAAFSARAIASIDDTPEIETADAIRSGDVIDLTRRMRPDGTLEWKAPAGRWVVLRFGYSLLGQANGPASPPGTGLEVDKLSRVHVRSYIEQYLRQYQQALGADWMGTRGLRNLHLGSFEAGPQNWTDDMLEQFKRLRGYDARPWLPVLAGRVVKSAAASDRFLWDFRQTIGDLVIEAHYGEISAALRERGMGSYFESQAERRAFQADGMRMKQAATIPMGEMWAQKIPFSEVYTDAVYDADVRESASVSHVYGKPLVSAESLTSYGGAAPYSLSPEALKPTVDRLLAMGINRFVLHTSVHQPLDKPGPGITLGPFGQWFTRKETWAEQAGAWMNYLARSAYLLQQGRFVAEVAYLYGEDINLAGLFWNSSPPVPEGYNFDFVNAEIVKNELSVRDGLLATRSGMTYRVLALDPSTARMSLSLLRRIRDLVREGAVVVGAKPLMTPSLADDEQEFRRIADEVWSRNRAGVGAVIADSSLADAMHRLGIAPDFAYTKPRQDTSLFFTHRTMEDAEIYFVNSRNAGPQSLEASFRVTGKVPELWRADTGETLPLSYRTEGGRTIVPLELDPNDAVFVVFRKPTNAPSAVIAQPRREVLGALEGSWEVSFPPDLGAPARARFNTLYSWTDSADAGIKYFSGTATYSKTLKIRGEWLKSRSRVQLDLGEVKNLAEVRVNGRSLGVLWKAPFRLDITEALKAGDNVLEIKVTNLWSNRLIGDKQPGATPIAYATYDPFEADSPLLPSGLLGPVTLSQVTQH